jgi:hypothetical protein
MVFDRLGRKGIGVVGLEDRNYTPLAPTHLPFLVGILTEEAALNIAISDA